MPLDDPGAVFNVGSGRQGHCARSWPPPAEVFDVAAEPDWGSMPQRAWDTTVWIPDPCGAAQVFGWRATTSLHEGLRRLGAWLREHPELVARYRAAGTRLPRRFRRPPPPGNGASRTEVHRSGQERQPAEGQSLTARSSPNWPEGAPIQIDLEAGWPGTRLGTLGARIGSSPTRGEHEQRRAASWLTGWPQRGRSHAGFSAARLTGSQLKLRLLPLTAGPSSPNGGWNCPRVRNDPG